MNYFLNSISDLVLNMFDFLTVVEIQYIVALLLVIFLFGSFFKWLKF